MIFFSPPFYCAAKILINAARLLAGSALLLGAVFNDPFTDVATMIGGFLKEDYSLILNTFSLPFSIFMILPAHYFMTLPVNYYKSWRATGIHKCKA